MKFFGVLLVLLLLQPVRVEAVTYTPDSKCNTEQKVEDALLFYSLTRAAMISVSALKKKRKELLLKHHPDKGNEPSEELTRNAVNAYTALLPLAENSQAEQDEKEKEKNQRIAAPLQDRVHRNRHFFLRP